MMNIKGDKIEFEFVDDKDIYLIKDIDGRTLCEITGYGVQIKFNLDNLNTPSDIDLAVDGIGQLFREIITEQLLSSK